jgi:signal transduction histidine kinase
VSLKKQPIDWRLLVGFSALLLLIIIIGVIGIFQIQSSAKITSNLGQNYLPIQRAVLEMRINNNFYARGIRNYFLWENSKYLEAARVVVDLKRINRAAEEFDRQLNIYSSLADNVKHKKWVEEIRDSEKKICHLGSKIINLVGKKNNKQEAAQLIRDFESHFYRLDNFLNNTVQDFNLSQIKEEIKKANLQKKKSVSFLMWSLILGVFIGAETGWVVYCNHKHQSKKQQQLIEKMIRIEEESKANLSLQVHNQMGQDLSALRIYLDLVNQKFDQNSKQAKKNIAESKKVLTGLIKKTHNISELLRPPSLDEVGLADTVEALIIQYRKMGQLNIDYRRPKKPTKLSGEHSLTIYRIAQEGLTNIIKHADAKNVKVSLEVKDKFVELIVKDDGKGFNYKKLLKPPRRRKGDKLKLGLQGLKERVQLLGGRMDIETTPGEGTLLKARLFRGG